MVYAQVTQSEVGMQDLAPIGCQAKTPPGGVFFKLKKDTYIELENWVWVEPQKQSMHASSEISNAEDRRSFSVPASLELDMLIDASWPSKCRMCCNKLAWTLFSLSFILRTKM